MLQQDLAISSSPNPNNNHDRVSSSPSCNACIFLFYKQKIEIKKSEKKLGQCGRCWQSLEPNQLLSCYLLGFCPNNVFLSFNDNLKCQFHFPPLSMTIPYRDGARSENLIGQVVMRHVAAAWRCLLFCQNLRSVLLPCLFSFASEVNCTFCIN